MSRSKFVENVRDEKANMSDERRLVAAAQQEPARFVELYESYFGVVYGFVARRVGDRAETEDLTAEVFRKALASLPRFKWTGAPFGAWLIRIASNMIADRAKRAGRERAPGGSPLASSAIDTGGLPSHRQAQQTDLETAERRAQLFQLVGELADDQRNVIVMRFAEEKSIHEIAEALGRSDGAVKQLQLRALQNLRAKFGSQQG